MDRKGFAPIIIIVGIVAVLVIAGIVGYIVLYKATTTPPTIQRDTEAQSTSTPIGNLIPTRTDWQTFTNQQYGFAVQYPPELVGFTENTGSKESDGSYSVGECGGDNYADAYFEAQGGQNLSIGLLHYQDSITETGMFTPTVVSLAALKQGITAGKINWKAVDPTASDDEGEFKIIGPYKVYESAFGSGGICAGVTMEIKFFTPKYYVVLSVLSESLSPSTTTFNLLENMLATMKFF